MKSVKLASILLTMLKRGEDVQFYSRHDGGFCFLRLIDGEIIAEYIYPPASFRPTGEVCAVTDIYEWVSLRKISIKSFLKSFLELNRPEDVNPDTLLPGALDPHPCALCFAPVYSELQKEYTKDTYSKILCTDCEYSNFWGRL